ncbi:MAG: hypothetical protein LBR91_00155 [Puniceicoccales bacterium]|nr:hypothetical protein [Puniceicoccales bacterium]
MKNLPAIILCCLLLLITGCSTSGGQNAEDVAASSKLPWSRPTEWEKNPILRLEDLSYSSESEGGVKHRSRRR